MKKQIIVMSMILSTQSAMATDSVFDRLGTGFNTSITPAKHLVWEQGLVTAQYREKDTTQSLTLNADTQFRFGLGKGYELQLGWNGYTWQQIKQDGVKSEVDGIGDSFVAVKKYIDLNDDRLKWALRAKVDLTTGDDEFTAENDRYSLGSTLEYQYDDLVKTAITMNYGFENGANWFVQAIPTLVYQFNERWHGFSEFVYNKKESQKNQKSLATGVAYHINDKAQIDASVGLDLNRNEQRSYNAGLGFSILF